MLYNIIGCLIGLQLRVQIPKDVYKIVSDYQIRNLFPYTSLAILSLII